MILREGLLVRVVGNLRDYEGKVHVLVFDITPISDWNELSYHILDTVLTHLQNTRGPIPVSFCKSFRDLLQFRRHLVGKRGISRRCNDGHH